MGLHRKTPLEGSEDALREVRTGVQLQDAQEPSDAPRAREQQPKPPVTRSQTAPRRSGRRVNPPARYDPVKGYQSVSAFLSELPNWLGPERSSMERTVAQLHSLMLDSSTQCIEGGVHPALVNYLEAFAAKKSRNDPDTPMYHEALAGPYKEEFKEAMAKEIAELEKGKVWTLTKRSEVPEGARVLPGTWAFKIKRFAYGQIRKFKARFCVRGDKQVEGIDYFDTYAPVVSWTTV